MNKTLQSQKHPFEAAISAILEMYQNKRFLRHNFHNDQLPAQTGYQN